MSETNARRLNRGAASLALSVAFLGTAAVSLAAEAGGIEVRPVRVTHSQAGGIEVHPMEAALSQIGEFQDRPGETSPSRIGALTTGCGGTITPTLSAEVIDPCGEVDVEVVVTPPECTRCTRLNVVFIHVGRARAASWMIEESLDALEALAARDGGSEPLDVDIRVGVITYDTVTATVAVEMTDDFSEAREALRLPVVGDAHGGYIERAARLAVEMLTMERALAGAEGAVPCDMATLFASTSAFNIAGGLLLRNAAGTIEDAAVPLIVGCPELISSNCIFSSSLPSSPGNYTEPPDAGKLRSAVQAEAAALSAPLEIEEYDATLTQGLPAGLEYVEDSGMPPPTVRSVAGETFLEWRLIARRSDGAFTFSYRTAPTALGEFEIEGGARFVIADGPDVVLSMIPARLEVTGECVPTPTPSAETAGPTTPASSPTPVTLSPTPTIPELTPGPVVSTIHLPVAYRRE